MQIRETLKLTPSDRISPPLPINSCLPAIFHSPFSFQDDSPVPTFGAGKTNLRISRFARHPLDACQVGFPRRTLYTKSTFTPFPHRPYVAGNVPPINKLMLPIVPIVFTSLLVLLQTSSGHYKHLTYKLLTPRNFFAPSIALTILCLRLSFPYFLPFFRCCPQHSSAPSWKVAACQIAAYTFEFQKSVLSN